MKPDVAQVTESPTAPAYADAEPQRVIDAPLDRPHGAAIDDFDFPPFPRAE